MITTGLIRAASISLSTPAIAVCAGQVVTQFETSRRVCGHTATPNEVTQIETRRAQRRIALARRVRYPCTPMLYLNF